MRVSGHGLQREGRAHDEAGRYIGTSYGPGEPLGYGLCECGAMSPPLDSTAARRRWHVGHKDEVLAERERLNREAAERFLDA
jgi:hypothetical protein